MGEIAEMVLDGDLCQECGTYIDDGAADGYPRSCEHCQKVGKKEKKARRRESRRR